MSTNNNHLRDYLRYYLGLDAPGFATLVDGPWGVGKTFQVRQLLAELGYQPASAGSLSPIKKYFSSDNEEQRFVYVSLYGISNNAEIDTEIISCLFPWSKWKITKLASTVSRAILNHAKITIPNIEIASLIDKSNVKLFIFDDLERCGTEPSKILGYLNPLVERDGANLIIIANNKEIDEKYEFNKIKEKLIGHTVLVKSDFDHAFDSFSTSIFDDGLSKLLNDLKAEIKLVYEMSSTENLRTLKMTMMDFHRLIKIIEQTYIQNMQLMKQVCKIFFSLSFDARTGRIKSRDLFDRMDQLTKSYFDDKNEPKNRAIVETINRYNGIEITDVTLPDEILKEMLFDGIFNSDSINLALKGSGWSPADADEPAWKITWQSYQREDLEVNEAIQRLLKEFYSGKITSSGDLLHSFGQILWAIRVGVIDLTVDEALRKGLDLIAELRDARKLEPLYGEGERDFWRASYAGYGFAEKEQPAFKEFWDFLDEQRQCAAKDLLPDIAVQLLSILRRDPDEFSKRISPEAMGGEAPVREPFLAQIDPKEFAEALLNQPAPSLHNLLLALGSRYTSGHMLADKDSEFEWLRSVEIALENALRNVPKVTAVRIRQNFDWTIGKHIHSKADGE